MERFLKILSSISFTLIFKQTILLTKHQSDIHAGIVVANQLLYLLDEIPHFIVQNLLKLEEYLLICLYEAKLWHDGLILQLEQNGIWGNLLKQRAVLNYSYSNYSSNESGVPQGAVLYPLLSSVYNYYQERNIIYHLLAENTMFFSIVKNSEINANDLPHMTQLRKPPKLFNGTFVVKMNGQKHLALILDSSLSK